MQLRPRTRITAASVLVAIAAAGWAQQGPSSAAIALPPAEVSGGMPLADALAARRSLRQFAPTPLTLEQIGQLCWAAQGITGPTSDSQQGRRTAPSAGGLYPIELFLVTPAGVQHYSPHAHALKPHLAGDLRAGLARAALSQDAVAAAPLCLVITAAIDRTAAKYGQRAERYCFLEAGHVAQNVLLQAAALNLAGVPIGAFEDAEVARMLKLPAGHQPLYLIPLGRPVR